MLVFILKVKCFVFYVSRWSLPFSMVIIRKKIDVVYVIGMRLLMFILLPRKQINSMGMRLLMFSLFKRYFSVGHKLSFSSLFWIFFFFFFFGYKIFFYYCGGRLCTQCYERIIILFLSLPYYGNETY